MTPFRQIIESVSWTLQGQLGLEGHGGRKPVGVRSAAHHRYWFV